MKLSTKIIYVHDPLCGWCYSVRRHVRRVWEELSATSTFQFVNAGLWVGRNARPMDERLRHHLRKSAPLVTKSSGETFGRAFWTRIVGDDNFVYDTGIAARFCQLVKQRSPRRYLQAVEATQEAFFIRGENCTNVSTFVEIGQTLGMPPTSVVSAMWYDENVAGATADEFAYAKSVLTDMGAASLPTFVVESHGRRVQFDHQRVRLVGEFVDSLRTTIDGIPDLDLRR